MITEASLPIKTEHSYCNDVSELQLSGHVKVEDGECNTRGTGICPPSPTLHIHSHACITISQQLQFLFNSAL